MTDDPIARPKEGTVKPFGPLIQVPYRANFAGDDLRRVKQGLLPKAMEDKWIIYWADDVVHFHRSWTGMGIYQIHLVADGGGARVDAAFVAKKDDQSPEDLAYQAQLLDFLVGNLLLGRRDPFPLPLGHGDKHDGTLQHSVSGTGYPQKNARDSGTCATDKSRD
ncbi:hypothetical protein [Actibacterium sp. 188UL27-1]|uniref:hypothetical protein n=1 Tax=Actibacterium sp. 188UL27-1 TaxID=2786961 RepID=UPI00195BE88E|nr:hypothetical protein [Actibacterium sp. 188UL27-1]MBM7067460.1 hypothetical protein [Actibacterium sp. 188UL27-1]